MPTVALAPAHNRLTKSWRLFAASAVAIVHTGTLAETVLARIAFPAAAMGPNGIVQINSLWSFNNNANVKTMRTRFGPAGFSPATGNDIQGLNGTTSLTYQVIVIIKNRNDQASQVCGPGGIAGVGNSTIAVTTRTVDTTAAFDFIFTGQLANTADTLTLESYMFELFYGA